MRASDMRATAAESAPRADCPRAVTITPCPTTTARRPNRVVRAVVGVVVVVLLWVVVSRAYRRVTLDRGLTAARDALRSFQPKAAIELLKPVVEQHPDCAEAEFLLAVAGRRAGQLDKVDIHLKRAAELGWNAAEIDRQVCLTYFQVGDFRRAGPEMVQRLQEGGTDDEAEETYEAMARGYMSTMLLKQAAFILESWLGWRPDSVQARLMLADVAALGGDSDGEINCYREAVRSDPSSIEARRCLAHALILSHELEESHELLVGCLRDQPHNPDVLVNMAAWHQRSGQVEEAKKVVAQALALELDGRQRAGALSILGQIALAEKDYGQAARVLKEAIDADPAAFANVYALSQALSRGGQDEEAKVYFDRWQRSQAAEKKLADLHDDILRNPEDPNLRTEIAQALLDQGATSVGINWLLSVVVYHPAHPLANRLLAEHYEREGQTALATRYRAVAEGKLQPPSVSVLSQQPKLSTGPASAKEGQE
ncbi:MAG TPA: tetratricopeptide repeat protein [Pirellulales bacterium]|nr:tetratricopeptide repeat protein [Pirellulales bacterium]